MTFRRQTLWYRFTGWVGRLLGLGSRSSYAGWQDGYDAGLKDAQAGRARSED